MTNKTAKNITGTLTLLPIPCTTKPCLPGMALAVVNDNQRPFFLTKNGRFCMLNSAESFPEPGDAVVASGEVQEKQDINGNNFTAIEFTALVQV